MTHISPTFADVMMRCTRDGRPLRLVIFADELCPGNPFRPEKSRTLMCIYWSFIDWPSWMLSRSFAWPCFSILRSIVIEELEGAMTYLSRVILRTFFPETGESLATGVLIQSPNGPYIVKAVFAGWLCDLVGHKEVTQWKGHQGNVCCFECGNLHRTARGISAAGVIGLDCSDESKFARRTSADVYAIIDDIVAKQPVLNKTRFAELEKITGFNYVPNGLLFDQSLRSVYKPIEHTIRDWQHTMCQDGVANTCIAVVMRLIADRGFSLEQVRAFMPLRSLPAKYGSVRLEWLTKNRLKANTLTSFSSNVLSLVPIIFCFWTNFVRPIQSSSTSVDVLRCCT